MRVTTSNPARPGGGLETLEPRLLFCATAAVFADLASDLDAWWRFEDVGMTTVADDSGSLTAHAGSLNGAASVSALGFCGGSGLFAGGEMNVANHSDINLGTNTQRTIALWFQADDVAGAGRQLLYEEGGGTRGLNIYIEDGRLVVGGWNRSESGWLGTWVSTGAVESGRWHHVALTLDGGPTTQPDALHGYLDGQVFGSGEGSQLWSHSGDVTIGGVGDTRYPDGGGGSTGFLGHIDDIRIYNRALSAYDVSVLGAHFNEGAAITLAMEERGTLVAKHVARPDPTQSDETANSAEQQRAASDDVLPMPDAPQPAAAAPESNPAPGVDQAPAPETGSATTEAASPQPVAGIQPATSQHPAGGQETAAEDEHGAPATPEHRISEVETDPKQSRKPSALSAANRQTDAPADSDAPRESQVQAYPLLVRDDGRSKAG